MILQREQRVLRRQSAGLQGHRIELDAMRL